MWLLVKAGPARRMVALRIYGSPFTTARPRNLKIRVVTHGRPVLVDGAILTDRTVSAAEIYRAWAAR